MQTREEIIAFQALLLELLGSTRSVPQIIAELQARPECAPFAARIKLWEPRMIEVAAALVRKWGRRSVPGRGEGL